MAVLYGKALVDMRRIDGCRILGQPAAVIVKVWQIPLGFFPIRQYDRVAFEKSSVEPGGVESPNARILLQRASGNREVECNESCVGPVQQPGTAAEMLKSE